MANVDLHFFPPEDPIDSTELSRFWHFVRNFTGAKALRLKVRCLEEVAAVGKASRAELLCSFPDVERLDLEGGHCSPTNTAAVAIANLLRCCHAVRDLGLKLSTLQRCSATNKERTDYQESIQSFFMHGRLLKPPHLVDDSYGGAMDYEDTRNVPGLSGRSFACLQSRLRRVRVRFRLDESSFGLRLVKFFADSAMVLQEIYFEAGSRRLCDHMSIDMESWIVTPNESSKFQLKHKNLDEGSWEFTKKIDKESIDAMTDATSSTVGFKILPLQR